MAIWRHASWVLVHTQTIIPDWFWPWQTLIIKSRKWLSDADWQSLFGYKSSQVDVFSNYLIYCLIWNVMHTSNGALETYHYWLLFSFSALFFLLTHIPMQIAEKVVTKPLLCYMTKLTVNSLSPANRYPASPDISLEKLVILLLPNKACRSTGSGLWQTVLSELHTRTNNPRMQEYAE